MITGRKSSKREESTDLSVAQLVEARAKLHLLSDRERECLRLVGTGFSSKKIARVLSISPASVDTHVQRARSKLGVRERRHAAALVVEAEAPAAAPPATRPRSMDPLAFGQPPLEMMTPFEKGRLLLIGMTVVAVVGAAAALVLARL